MHFRAVADRCAVEMRQVDWCVTEGEALDILASIGFRIIRVNVVEVARQLVGASYRRGARLSEAPKTFDCSSFTKHLYGQRGIWLPRRSIQQRHMGAEVALSEVDTGDLIFCSGHRDYFDSDPRDGVGHVGIATGIGTVVHAVNKRSGVVEVDLDRFLGVADAFRSARRLIAADQEVVTLQCPATREVETSDDLRWIVLQTLSSKDRA